MLSRILSFFRSAPSAPTAPSAPVEKSGGYIARFLSCFRKAAPPAPASVPAPTKLEPERVQLNPGVKNPGFGKYLGKGKWENDDFQPTPIKAGENTLVTRYGFNKDGIRGDHQFKVNEDGIAEPTGTVIS